MDTAKFLKSSANALMVMTLVKRVADDLAREVRRDVGSVARGVNHQIRQSPYQAAGGAAVVGILVGALLARSSRRGTYN